MKYDDMGQPVKPEAPHESAANFRRYLSEAFRPRNGGEGMDRHFLIELCDQVLDKRVNRVSN